MTCTHSSQLPSNASSPKREMAANVSEEIEELKRRIALLGWYNGALCRVRSVCECRFSADGDKKAYSESSQWGIKQNKELISKLRAENKYLRAKLSNRMKVTENSTGSALN